MNEKEQSMTVGQLMDMSVEEFDEFLSGQDQSYRKGLTNFLAKIFADNVNIKDELVNRCSALQKDPNISKEEIKHYEEALINQYEILRRIENKYCHVLGFKLQNKN